MPTMPHRASGNLPDHSCSPSKRKPIAIESKGSSPRPRSPSLGIALSAPSSASECAPKTLIAMRRDRSATVSSNGSQMPLPPRGAQKKMTPTASTRSGAYLRKGGPEEDAEDEVLAGGLSSIGSVMDR